MYQDMTTMVVTLFLKFPRATVVDFVLWGKGSCLAEVQVVGWTEAVTLCSDLDPGFTSNPALSMRAGLVCLVFVIPPREVR